MTDQTVNCRLLLGRIGEWQVGRAFGAGVGGELVAELVEIPRGGIDADVVMERSEMDEVAVEREGRHLILDRLLRLRCGASDRGPDLLQQSLNVDRERGDVFVDVAWCGRSCHHS